MLPPEADAVADEEAFAPDFSENKLFGLAPGFSTDELVAGFEDVVAPPPDFEDVVAPPLGFEDVFASLCCLASAQMSGSLHHLASRMSLLCCPASAQMSAYSTSIAWLQGRHCSAAQLQHG